MAKKIIDISKDMLYQKYWNEEKSISQIAKEFDISYGAIRNRMVLYNINRRKKCITGYGKNHPGWKGGNHITDSDGYILLRNKTHPNSSSNGYLREHIYVMSKHIKRPLEKGERVHHINGIKDDNRIENLFLCSNEMEHKRTHAQKERLILEGMKLGIFEFAENKYVFTEKLLKFLNKEEE